MNQPDWLVEIEQREAKATPGEWEFTEWPIGPELMANGIFQEEHDQYIICHKVGREVIQFPHDGEFIAHARTDIPTLIQAYKHLRKALEEAPHTDTCRSWSFNGQIQGSACNCWKSQALSFNPTEVSTQ